jgi:hypothetical protein
MLECSVSSLPTLQRTNYFYSIKTNFLMMFMEIIAIYCEIHKKHINATWVEGRGRNAKFLNVKAGGTCSSKD